MGPVGSMGPVAIDEVRDLLAGQGWFDLHQYRMAPPEGTLMHWSRLVDIPLAALLWLLMLVLPAAQAELITTIAITMAPTTSIG